jgi:hypothetical protein
VRTVHGVVVSLVVAAIAAGAAPAALAPEQVSSNWSGYAVAAPDGAAPISFSDVAGTFKLPKASCTKAGGTSGAFWVGIGGFSSTSSTLEQLGASVDCAPTTGKATYRTWTEIVPAAAHYLTMKVMPGDTITVAVVVQGEDVTMSLRDSTRGTRYSHVFHETMPLDTSSAEWIAEAPSICRSANACTVVPLADFGTASFTSTTAIGNGHPGTIVDPTWDATPLALVSSDVLSGYASTSNTAGAVPNTPSADGRSFTVSYRPRFVPQTQTGPPEPGAPLPPWVH